MENSHFKKKKKILLIESSHFLKIKWLNSTRMVGMIWHCFHFTDKETDYQKRLK